MVHAALLWVEQQLALKVRHDLQCNADPGAIMHLGKKGLIEISDSTVASEMKCLTSWQSKSEVPPHGRG